MRASRSPARMVRSTPSPTVIETSIPARSRVSVISSRETDFNGDIGYWETSGVMGFVNTFKNAKAFNQDLSSWCAEAIEYNPDDASQRFAFSPGADNWTLPKPDWGAPCP